PVLRRAHIATRLGTMLASYSNWNPANADAVIATMVEHVADVEGLSNSVLEATCRELKEQQKYAPETAEVMTVVRAQMMRWRAGRLAIRDGEDERIRLVGVLREHAEAKRKAEHERKVRAAKAEMGCWDRVCMRLQGEILEVETQAAQKVETLREKQAHA